MKFVSRAFALASAGRPGPVVLSLPKDTLEERIRAKALSAAASWRPRRARKICAKLERLIAAASRPPLILGRNVAGTRKRRRPCMNSPSVSTCAVRERVIDVLPLFDALDPRSTPAISALNANPELIKLVQDSDLLLLVGGGSGNSVAILSPARYSLAAHDLRSCLSADGGVRPVYAPNLAFTRRPRAPCAALSDLRWRRTSPRGRWSAHENYLGFTRHKARRSADVISPGHAVGERQPCSRRAHLHRRGQFYAVDI